MDEIANLKPCLSEAESAPLRILFTLDYQIQRITWLAEVGAENVREEEDDAYRSLYRNYSANDPQGNHIRALLRAGWAVRWQLSDIAREVIGRQLGSTAFLSRKCLSRLTRGLASVQNIEYAIQREQLAYVQTMSGQEEQGYHFTSVVIGYAFRDRVFDNPGEKKSPNWRTGNNFSERGSWLKWLILREGPRFFIKAWASKEGNEACLRLIRTEWAKRTPKQILVESDATYTVNNRIEDINEFPREEVESLMEDGRGDHYIEKTFKEVHFFLGRRLDRNVIRSIEREYSDYGS